MNIVAVRMQSKARTTKGSEGTKGGKGETGSGRKGVAKKSRRVS